MLKPKANVTELLCSFNIAQPTKCNLTVTLLCYVVITLFDVSHQRLFWTCQHFLSQFIAKLEANAFDRSARMAGKPFVCAAG